MLNPIAGATVAARPSSSVWTDRLAEGATFSCALDWGPGQVLESFWREVFATTRPGAKILEIGCGSAEVSLWAAEAGRGFRITATDVHHHVDAVRRHADLSFLGGVSAEALPFPGGAFDMVVSNFGIEYAPRDASMTELARVLRPGGAAALVMHSADSTITASSRIAIETHERLIEAGTPEKVHRAAALRPDHLSRRKLLKEVLNLRAEIPVPRLSYSGVEYFDIAERLLRADPAARRDLEALDRAVEMRIMMSREQARVALGEADVVSLISRLRSLGVAAEISELSCTYDNGAVDMVGWIALLTKTV
jgi:SAM-dependent methyltransferase